MEDSHQNMKKQEFRPLDERTRIIGKSDYRMMKYVLCNRIMPNYSAEHLTCLRRTRIR